MKKSAMISVQPYWVFLIIAHKKLWNIPQRKTVEVRKDYPKSPEWDKKTFIYCSKDKKSFKRIPKEYQPLMEPLLGKVVGEFVCDMINEYEFFIGHGVCGYVDGCQSHCLTREELCEYGNGKNLYGWRISDLKVYDQPKELSEFRTVLSLADMKCKHREERYRTFDGKRYFKCNLQNCVCEFYRLARQTDCDGFENTREKHNLTRPPQSWQFVEEI